ncbi:MAG: Rne/Rng family ribonuclease [Alphaproteobacteria bacterium]|nr:Rne/Rng family ribonuclease [Alphaproteobacteria bacterium]
MTKKMLIDATHSEETRVAVMDGDRLEEFDYESKFRKPLKGSIFLAKVTRVEPSLQAAFVNFGGNRHGFLPFSEIHPDYFRIPISDREALIAEQEAALQAHDEEEQEQEAAQGVLDDHEDADGSVSDVEELVVEDLPEGDEPLDGESDDSDADAVGVEEDQEQDSEKESDGGEETDADADSESGQRRRRYPRRNGRGGRYRGGRMAQRSRRQEVYDEEQDDEQRFRFNLRRKYKIQEVIKRGQIMLVQVSKEERGNKGAAVSSYLSLPGRYCVLMPNSPRAGGVSRKIASSADRARMREIMKDLEVPKGMSVILRTAGVTRTKTEIKRDLDYLMRLWDSIRELTLESTAPAMVYEEADLIKRAVRDLYTRDIEEIHVEGDDGFKNAKSFMKMMIPSHVKRVHHYKDNETSLFQRYRAEEQISEIGETSVTLKSGGYLVINPTEALISIDVNSGKATKERHIEETALKTNLEAAEEVARQLRLRDLGGLVVVDFIDMEDRRNNAKVERRMRDSLANDRARIQVGRISAFGLMEMSRQRLNPSLTESQFEVCSSCQGTGRTRTADAASIMVLRAIENEGAKARAAQIIVHVTNDVALYILNHKRKNLISIEERYGFEILMRVDDTLGVALFRIEVSRPVAKDDAEGDEGENANANANAAPKNEATDSRNSRESDERGRGGRRRGRRGGRRRGQNNEDNNMRQDSDEEVADSSSPEIDHKNEPSQAEDGVPKEGRSSGGRGRKPARSKAGEGEVAEGVVKENGQEESQPEEKKPTSRGRKPASKPAKKAEEAKTEDSKDKNEAPDSKEAAPEDKPVKKPARGRKASVSNDDKPAKEKAASAAETVNEPPKEKKKGWWSR